MKIPTEVANCERAKRACKTSMQSGRS